MKYGNYKLRAKGYQYVGDWIQIIAVDELYKQMGIDLDDVVYLDMDEMISYVGEYVIMPVSMPLINYVEGGLSAMFSDHIIPVFLGLTLVKEHLTEQEVGYLRRFAPIGCRDETTLRTIRSHGISAFLNGCLTITLPRIEHECVHSEEEKRPYVVDIHSSLIPQLPEEIKEKAVFRTHQHPEVINGNYKETARQILCEYMSSANLVITSLLHCALPCLAMGIPVVLIKKSESISYRFAWLEKLIPIYSESDLRANRINWYPAIPKQFQIIRQQVYELDTNLLISAYDFWHRMLDVSWFYEDREKKIYFNDACESLKMYLDKHWTDKMRPYNYGIWGLTQLSEWLYNYITEAYPMARLCHVYDQYRHLNFQELCTESPENIAYRPDEFIFVTSAGASEVASQYFNSIGRSIGTYGLCEIVR